MDLLGAGALVRTLGKGIVEVDTPQGVAADGASCSNYSDLFALWHGDFSTTHVATGSILGTGLGRKGAEVRWGVAGRMVIAWVLLFPPLPLSVLLRG